MTMTLLLAACLALLPLRRQDGELHDPAFDGFGARWAAAAEELGAPGVAVVVVEGDRVIHLETLGLRDPERGLPVTPDTIFYIASATKPFVAMAVMQLAEEGRLDLDASVRSILPRFRVADEEATETITGRDRLRHRPGLNSFPIVFLDAYTGEITEDRYYHFLAEVEPTGLAYTNVHFTLAGRVIEALEGKSWKDVLDERIFTPAGMDRTTGYADWMYAQEDVAIPTVLEGGVAVPAAVRKTDATMHAAGGLGTTIADLGRWLRVQLGGGAIDGEELLSPEAHAETLAEQSRLPRPDGWLRRMEGWGLGWSRGTYRGHRYFQHGGGYVGSASLIAFLPDPGIGVAVLANGDGPGQAICSVVSIDVIDFLLGDDSGYDPLADFRDRVPGPPAAAPASADPASAPGDLPLPPEAYAGTFRNEYWGDLRLECADGALAGRMGNLRFAVRPEGTDRFRISGPVLQAEGAFQVEGGRVVALEAEIQGRKVRFVR